MFNFEAPSVSELVASIKTTLENEFNEVMVEGEITNLSLSASGHWYFTLSDESAAISCALFKGDALRNPLIRNLKDGDKVIVAGPISVFAKRGTFQILAKKILPAGAGQLKLQFERLKAKLSQEGLFDLEIKKKIPDYPKKVVVITAENGAALADFLNVYKRRSLWCDILIIPALVQGDLAPKSLREGLAKALKVEGADVIVLTRGGGSLEDLWAFNDEELVRDIFKANIPVVSAVGHQVDFCLCDYVADLRAETPTAAAEILTQSQMQLNLKLQHVSTNLKSQFLKLRQSIELMIERFHPKELRALMWKKMQESSKALNEIRLRDRSSELVGHREGSQLLDECFIRLNYEVNSKIKSKINETEKWKDVLNALGPRNVLQRGYTFVQIQGGEVVTSLQQYKRVQIGTKLELHFHDGDAIATRD